VLGPFSEADDVSNPVSPYAATKRAGELICYTYSHLYRLRVACLRFFTVYGPRQRPDLAIHKFARLMAAEKSLPVFGDGTTQRDYTYVDDIVDGIIRSWEWLQRGDTTAGLYDIFNLGGSNPVRLIELIRLLEQALHVTAMIDWQPAQPGDVPITFADLRKSQALLGYQPQVDIATGIQRFAAWFQSQRSLSETA
jgi:UDP-glucuronate 4-epimerase